GLFERTGPPDGHREHAPRIADRHVRFVGQEGVDGVRRVARKESHRPFGCALRTKMDQHLLLGPLIRRNQLRRYLEHEPRPHDDRLTNDAWDGQHGYLRIEWATAPKLGSAALPSYGIAGLPRFSRFPGIICDVRGPSRGSRRPDDPHRFSSATGGEPT